MVKRRLLQGLASLFKGKGQDAAKTTLPDTTDNVSNIFTKNIVDEFGQDEVKEAFRILDTRTTNPELDKIFYRADESKLDELVNLLEGRYMSSERLHASPISFRRRGPGAAERYLKINDSGSRLTDLPGGPGDRVLYGKNYGEMSMTTNLEGKRVYKNEKPTIFDEGTQVTDKGKTIEGVAEEIPTGIPAATKVDDMVTKMQAMEKEAESMLAFAKRDQQQISDAIDTFNRMMDDGEDPAEAIRMLKEIMKKGRSKNAKGGRIKMFKGGLARLLKMINPELERRMVKTGPFETGHRADAVVDMEQIKNIARNEATNLEDIYKIEDMIQNSPRYNDKMKNAFMNLIDYEKFRANALYDNPKLQKHMKNDPEGTEEFLRMVYKEQGSDSGFNMGGRVGMLAGGSLIGKGIMEAAKLAQRGMKPFGAKQTYKQNVTQKGVSNEQFDEIFKKQLNRVPDEVVDEPTGRGLNSSLLEAEAILTGQKFGLLTQAQRTKIAQAMRDKVAKQIYDDPNPRLSNDYFEYMDNAVDRMDDLLEIEKLGGDLTPKPIFDGTEIIGAQVDFRQLDKLGNKAKDNIIPFKPKTKKSKGGTVPPLKGPMSDGMGSLFRSK
tara:strand:- start:561 stop:2378 length:1818 start_codon:yes stop_codon:yes gene_type:complete